METQEDIRPLPDRPPRYCPACGARVAEGAKTCLMCGASLEEVEETEDIPLQQATSVRQLTSRQILILGAIALILLGGAIFLGWKFSQGEVLPAPPKPTLTATMTLIPTATLPPTLTPTPTFTPSPQPTPTPAPPEVYIVQSGDTLLEIALNRGLTVEELKQYNSLESDIIVEGQNLLIPPLTPTPGPTPTLEPGKPTHTPSPFTLYTVTEGDTLSTIAEEFNVSVADIRAANDIPADSETIRQDQVLQIPQYTPTPPVATAEYVAQGTPAPRSAYASPTLLYPPNEATFNGPEALIILQWASVGILEENTFYQVTLTYPMPTGPQVEKVYLQATAWRVPADFFPPANSQERLCTWEVSVVKADANADTYSVLGPPNQSRSFFWEVQQP